MSDTENSVTCGEHGEREPAFVCQHLVNGSGLGFHCAENPENPVCPDAWCDTCNAAVEEAGDWNDETMALADIKLVCDLCYESLRERNWLEEPGALDRLLDEAMPHLKDKQARMQEQFRLGDYERYDWDQQTAQLVFSHNGSPRVVADVVFVGSLSTSAGTWMWSWANTSHLEPVKARMREVRQHGREHRLLKLAAAHWPATAVDGWEMTAIASLLLDAVGAYRAPSQSGFLFMVMTDVRWAS